MLTRHRAESCNVADQERKEECRRNVDPGHFVVRYKYFASLQARWGGSLQQMLDFEKQVRAAGLPDAHLR